MVPARVVPDEPVNQLGIEHLRCREVRGMVINKFLLNGAVEPFAVGVHLWRLGIGMIMNHMQASQLFVKMLHELAAVVGKHKGNREWKYLEAEKEEFLGRL